MADWLTGQGVWLVPTLLVVAVVGLAAAIIFGVLWRKEASASRGRDDRSVDMEHRRIDAELRVAEITDRLRLITDVHDAAAVSITSLISRAEGAKFAAGSDPQAATRAAQVIADEARVILGDLRRVVNTARAGVSEVEEGPSLVSLQDLFSAMDQSGIVVRFEETGTAFPIGSSAELGIFRIVQEALNNARQHGGPGTTVKVTMAWSQQGMHLRIDDDGIRAKNRLTEQGIESSYGVAEHQQALIEVLQGRGMKDMKARTEAFGGVFSAHRVPGVGFSISAAFPTLRFHNGVHGVGIGVSVASAPSAEASGEPRS